MAGTLKDWIELRTALRLQDEAVNHMPAVLRRPIDQFQTRLLEETGDGFHYFTGTAPASAMAASSTCTAAGTTGRSRSNAQVSPRCVQTAFEKFFSLNPAADSWRHNYAKYAYQCEQWDVFKKQLQFFKGTNYSYFGGRETFERMVSNAERKASTARRN